MQTSNTSQTNDQTNPRATGQETREPLSGAIEEIHRLNPNLRLYPENFVEAIAKRLLAAKADHDLDVYREIIEGAPTPILAFLTPAEVARLAAIRGEQNRMALGSYQIVDAAGELLPEWNDFLALPELGVTLSELRRQAGNSEAALRMARSDHYLGRRMIAEAPRQTERLAMYFHLVGGRDGEEAYCSRWTMKYLKRRYRAARQWASLRLVSPQGGGEPVPLARIVDGRERRQAAEQYVLIRGIEAEADREGLVGVFATLTLPPQMHPNPMSGKSSWDGTLPRQGAANLSKFWRRARSMMSKSGIEPIGFWTKEIGQDATPHMHVMGYLRPGQLARFMEIIDHIWNWKGPMKPTVDDMGRPIWSSAAAEVRVEDRSIGRLSMYAFKHVRKTFRKNTPDQGAAVSERVQAAQRLWGFHRFEFFGIDCSISTWRLLRGMAPDKLAGHADAQAMQKAAKSANWLAFRDATPVDGNGRSTLRPLYAPHVSRYGARGRKLIGLWDTTTGEVFGKSLFALAMSPSTKADTVVHICISNRSALPPAPTLREAPGINSMSPIPGVGVHPGSSNP